MTYAEKPINFLLLLTALSLALVFFPLGVLMTLVLAFSRISFVKVTGYLSQMALALALSIDLMGNVLCRDLLNRTLRHARGPEFGDYQETISSVLGRNKAAGSLTAVGRWLADLLNKIDPGHVERAAGL